MLGESGSVFLDGHDNDKPLLKALEGSKGTERRNWNIKKINPLEKQAPRPAVGLSEDRKTSRVSAALGSTYTIRDIDFSSQKLSKLEQQNYTATFDEGGAKIKAMPSRMKPDPVLTAWVPSIQACEQTSSNNGAGGGGAGNESVCPGIPYSYSSSKAQRAGTRFPSVEKLHIDRLLEKEKKQDKHAADAIGRFGGSYTPRTIKGVIELKHMDDLQAQAPTGVDMAYLPAHTSMFAVPVSETRKADSMARVVKLRKAYDQALGHRQRKVQLLNSMKTKVEEREQHDEFIAETVAIGERTMAALELRVRRMQVELQASDALGDFYDKIVQQCSDTRNPASEKIRLKEMEQQVKLSKLQVRDMLLKRQELYNEKDNIEKHDIVKIKHERNTCIGLRSALKRRLQTVLKSIEKLKADRIELNQSALMNSTEWKLTSSMFGGNVLKKPNLAQSPSSNGINELTMPSVASTGTSSAPPNEANIISNNTSTTSPTTKNKKNKSSLLKNNDDHDENEESIIIEGDEAQHDDSSSPAAAVESNNKKEERTQTPKLRVALKMLKTAEKEKKAEEQRIAMIRVRETEESFGCKFDITDPYSFDAEVLKKMKQGELLHENLLLQQQQLENRIAILKENHEKAKQELEAMRIMNKEDQKKSSTSKKSSSSLSNKDKKAKNHNKDEKASLPIGSSDIAREHRRLEDALSKAEITCNQSFRKLQKSMKSIEDVRAGVQHLGEIILAFDNAGVLPPRPPSTNASATMFILDKEAIQQSFYDNKVLHEILIAAEQQVVAVKDELSLGAQMGEGLAGRSPSSNKKDPLDHLPIPKNKNRNKTSYSGSGGGHGKVIRGLGKGTASSLLVTDQEQSEMVKVRVLTKLDNERKTAKSVINHRKEQDDILVLREGKIPAKPRFEAGLKTFLNDSLAGEQTISNQRKANVLAGSKQGATAPKGLALDDVLYQNQPNNNNSNGVGVKKSEKSSSSSSQVTMLGSGDFQTVVDRESLKKSSQGLVARKKAVERRAARIKEAEERKLLEDGGN
jgi:uncharacterized small protein (DUF1192 family)